MRTIKVGTSKKYNVIIGDGLISTLGNMTADLISGRKATIVSDNNVWSFFGEAVTKSLENAGFTSNHFLISPGESSKNTTNYLALIDHLCHNELTRSDCIIALGGGVVGDLAGFAAATYLRGIAYVQVPTSLLAMVDSSVGGKTGIDLPSGKNQMGAFYQPNLVVCDTNTLQTLPKEVLIEGCAEVIKYGILYDATLFSYLQQHILNFDPEYVIARCVELKKQVVEADELDQGCRQMLNLGHTLGHSIERISNYTVSHGAAVAIGISMICRSSVQAGLCTQMDCNKMIQLLENFGLPTSAQYTAHSIALHALSDKKRSGDTISLVIPSTIGCCKLISLPITDFIDFVKEGM